MTPESDASPLRTAARLAFIYALPLTEIARVRAAQLGAGVAVGRFFALKGLATPADRFVTTPNADTIYANAFIDLRQGPARLTLPPLGERYGSLSLMDMFSDNIAVLGSRTTGQAGATFTLVGPHRSATGDAIRSPTPWVWALARVLVDGPEDVAAARAVLDGFACEAAPSSGHAGGADRNGNWDVWLRAADALMRENPPLATDRRILQQMSPLGLGEAGFDAARFGQEEVEEIVAGMEEARAFCRSANFGGRRAGDWIYPAANTGNFFQDYPGRARIAVTGLAALPIAEATYIAALSPETGGLFAGEGPWQIRFTAGTLPPVEAFWSLTMYRAEADGAFFLTENPIDRYTISDRTPGLLQDADGGLDIWVARRDPGDARRANWLPAPADGAFLILLRCYLPGAAIVGQTYLPPAIRQV